jgi:putative pyruvate formate lyase activating enzyme
MNKCFECPRKCGADRKNSVGYCGASGKIKVARAALHAWEEPFISGKNGSGTVFFSHCNLKCIFCQNYKISHEGFGKEVSAQDLYGIFARLAELGAENINLVTPTHYADLILPSLQKFKKHYNLPIVFNCGGYEEAEILKRFEGVVDVWLPDMKYADGNVAKKLSDAIDYPQKNLSAVCEMKRQQPKDVFADGLMKSGVAIRHLILPNLTDQSIKILDIIADNFGVETYVSLMAQYEPFFKAERMAEINRKITQREYDRVVNYAIQKGFANAFVQDLSAADEKFVPEFNLQGV